MKAHREQPVKTSRRQDKLLSQKLIRMETHRYNNLSTLIDTRQADIHSNTQGFSMLFNNKNNITPNKKQHCCVSIIGYFNILNF